MALELRLKLWMLWLQSNLGYVKAPASLDAKFHRVVRRGVVPFLVAFIVAQLAVMLLYVGVKVADERSNIPILLNTVTLVFHALELGCLLWFCRQERNGWQRHVLDALFCILFVIEMCLLGCSRADMQHYLHYKIEGLPTVFWHFAHGCENDGDTDGEHHENICLIRSSHATHTLAQFWQMYFTLFVLPYGHGLLLVSIGSFSIYAGIAVCGLEDLHLSPTDSQGTMFLHADLVWMGTTMLVLMFARGMMHQARLAVFVDSEQQRQELISEKVLRCEAEFRSESFQLPSHSKGSTSDTGDGSKTISESQVAASIASAPALLMRTGLEFSLVDFVEQQWLKECLGTGDCLPSDGLVWVEGEASPVLLANLVKGQKVMCYDCLTHTPKYVPIENVSERASKETDEWVVVKLDDGTVLDMTSDHPVPRFDMLSHSRIDFVKASSLVPKSDKVMTWKMTTSKVESILPGTRADTPTKWMNIDVEHPERFMCMVSRGDFSKHTTSMVVGSSSLSPSQPDEEMETMSEPDCFDLSSGSTDVDKYTQGRLFKGRSSPLWKTRHCGYYAAGRCKYGSRCGFAHGMSDLRVSPDLSFTALCPVARTGGQCKNPQCRYAHNIKELRRDPKLRKQLCKHYLEGRCSAGNGCKFAHSMEDVWIATDLGRPERNIQRDDLNETFSYKF